MVRPDGRASARNILVLLLLWAVVCFLCSASSATIPHMINYQGKLTTASGGCLNDTVQMTFTIYSDSLGTSSDWTETQQEVVVKDGIFNVLLGSADRIPGGDTVFDGSVKYLGVQVESDPEMRPLKPMVSVAYAFRSAASDTANFALSAAPDDDWDLDTAGVNVYRLTGDVGIGTPSPQYKLDIQGTTGIDVGTNFGDIPLTINVPSDQSALISRIAKGGSVINVVDAEGNVGIGTFSPQEKLDVAGTARVTGFEMSTGASNGYVLTSDASGVGTWQTGGGGPSSGWVDDGDVVRLQTSTDSVGIGTANPGVPLQVGTGSHAPVFLNTEVQIDHDDAAAHRMEIRNDNGATGWSIDASGTTTFGPISATKDLHLLGGNSVRMTIDGSSGDVGIGTTSPDAPLQVGSGSHAPVLVNTSVQVDHDDASEHNIEIRNNSGATGWRINSTGSTTFGSLSAGQDLYLLGGNSTRMTIDGASGDVGIGTTTPEARLHVVPGGSQALTIQRDGEIQMGIRAYGSTAYPILNSRRARGTSASPSAVQNGDALFVFQSNGQTGPGSSGTGGQLVFEANQDWNTSARGTRIMLQGVSDNSTVLSEWMRLENSDVGIGKSPAEKLDVAGTVQMTGFKMPTGASNGYVLTSDANGVGTWQLSGGGGGWADDGTVVRLQTSTDRVGIGMTSPSGKLHVQSSDASMPDQSGVVHSEFTGSAPSLAKAVYGKSRPGDNKGIGGHFEGGNTGVFGIVYPTGSISYWGVTGIVNGGSGQCYGVKGQAWNGSGGTKYGVYGSADDGSTNYGVYGTHTGTGYGVYYSGGLAGSGSKSCVVKTSRGPTLLYCQESPENWFEDFGQGQLSSGRTHIELDPLFLETITIDDSNPIKVFVQLEGDCNGVYVSKGTTGFDVLELKNGTSNAPFSYRVVAKRKGFENKRLEYTQAGEADPYLYPEAAAKLEKERLEKSTAEE